MPNMYRELEIWHESVALIKAVYVLADKMPKSEEYNLKSQLKRAVVSVSLNIAEGKNRKTAKDFCHFLVISLGSLAEVDAIIAICVELSYFEHNPSLEEQISCLGRRINAFRSKIENSVKS